MHVPSRRGSFIGVAAPTKGDTYSQDPTNKPRFEHRKCSIHVGRMQPIATRDLVPEGARAVCADDAALATGRAVRAGARCPYAGPIWTPSTFAPTP